MKQTIEQSIKQSIKQTNKHVYLYRNSQAIIFILLFKMVDVFYNVSYKAVVVSITLTMT